jgi:hypothetical protein
LIAKLLRSRKPGALAGLFSPDLRVSGVSSFAVEI